MFTSKAQRVYRCQRRQSFLAKVVKIQIIIVKLIEQKSYILQYRQNSNITFTFQALRKPRLTWAQLSVLSVLYLTSIHIPSQSSTQMVDASVPFRFRFAPNNFGTNTGLGMNRLGTSSLVGSRRQKSSKLPLSTIKLSFNRSFTSEQTKLR